MQDTLEAQVEKLRADLGELCDVTTTEIKTNIDALEIIQKLSLKVADLHIRIWAITILYGIALLWLAFRAS